MSQNPGFALVPPKPATDYIVQAWIRRLNYLGLKEIEANQAANYIFKHSDFDDFLDKVFQVALGRKPAAHEQSHYVGLLRKRNITRTELADLVFTGEEASRHLAKIKKVGLTKLVRIPVAPPTLSSIQADSIQIPYFKDPTVSVIIPVYGKVEYTLQCLASISKHPSKTKYEVLVVDDCSPDDSFSILERIKGIRLVKNTKNLGFVRTCNHGASLARGEYLHFLNNDTTVTDGWLDELVKTFANFEGTAIAGSKLVYPDGSLQEAGAIVWQDASAWNYGNGKDPDAPEYNYARISDYVSGASLMVTREFFESVSGFDELYAPAYCEDSDLCFKARDKGYKVVYQPLSTVIHYEGVSSGRDLSSGTKAYQVVNMGKFKERWATALRSHRPNGLEPHLERDRGAKGRVLFIDACTPTPDQDSGSIDIYNLMKVFVGMGWAVTFIPEDNYAYMEKYTPMMQALGVQMLYHPHVKSVDQHISEFGKIYNLIMSFRPLVTAKHIDNIRSKCPHAKLVFNTVDLHFLRTEREAKLKGNTDLAKESQRLKKLELGLIKKADLTTVVSTTELDILKKLGAKNVVHLPFSREVRGSEVPFEKRSGLLFVGGFQHTPNVDAVLYFVNEVMPLLRKKIRGIVLNIVGSNAPREVLDLSSRDVVVHGFVEDLAPLLGSVRLNVAPLRYGAGTKGKVVQALAFGLPTVGTAIALEGMNLGDGSGVIKADTVDEMVDAICSVYKDPVRWEIISSRGLAECREEFGIDNLGTKIQTKILEIG